MVEGRRPPTCWNDVWDAFVNPNINKYPHEPCVCDCGSDGFFLRGDSIICIDCNLKIPLCRICPHPNTQSYTDYDSDLEGDIDDIFHGCVKCPICESVIDASDRCKYYLSITCTHDFRHVGEKQVDDSDESNNEREESDDSMDDRVGSYCFQCYQFL